MMVSKKNFLFRSWTKILFTCLFTTLNLIAVAQVSTPATLPDSSIDKPGEITSTNDLIWLTINSGYWDDNWIQTTDIVFSANEDWNGDGSVDAADDEGLISIGSSSIPFTGNYDGRGHSISNLYINKPTTSQVGLFGRATYAVIKDIELKDANVIGKQYVGALIGYLYKGSIKNSFIQGELESMFSTANGSGIYDFSGLLVGMIYESTVLNCGVVGTVTTVNNDSYCTGGLTGQNYKSSIINCYAIALTDDAPIVGHNHHTQTSLNQNIYFDSDYFANANGTAHTSGEQGLTTSQFASGANFSSWDFQNLWEITTLSIDNLPRPYLKHQIYDYCLTVEANLLESGISTSLELPEGSLTPTTYLDNSGGFVAEAEAVPGKSFLKWIDEQGNELGTANSYTIPANFFNSGDRTITAVYSQTSTLNGSGTDTDPYQITSLEDLILITSSPTLWDKSFKVMNDIAIDSDHTAVDWDGDGLLEHGSGGDDLLGFLPIASGDDASGNQYKFSGSIDGDGKTISNLYINREEESYIGLIAIAEGESISNLTLSNPTVIGSSYIGSFIGKQLSSSTTPSSIDGCHVDEGTLECSTRYVGAIIGESLGANASISNSEVLNTTIQGGIYFVGGAIGRMVYGTISNCSVVGGSVESASGYYIGGVVGCAENATVSQSKSSIDVKGYGVVGGVVGKTYYSSIVDGCYSLGDVEGSSYLGGVVGDLDKSTVKSSYSIGDIDGVTYVGGVVGRASSASGLIDGCFSSGAIYGSSSYIGGVVGRTNADILNCYFIGAVKGGSSVGGIAGANISNSTANIRTQYSYSRASVMGSSSFGALIGTEDLTYGRDIVGLYYDTERSQCSNNGVGNVDDSGESTEIGKIPTASFSNSSQFTSLSYGTSESAPWVNSSSGAPYLYWQASAQIPVVNSDNLTLNGDGTVSVNIRSVIDNGATIVESGVRWSKIDDDSWQYSQAGSASFPATVTTGVTSSSGQSYVQAYVKDSSGNNFYGPIEMLNQKYSGGSGTVTDPYIITLPEDLIELSNTREDWGAAFIQTADVVFDPDYTAVDWDGDGTLEHATGEEDSYGFKRVGTSGADGYYFTGSYRGYNSSGTAVEQREIKNLYIDLPLSDYSGLFGRAQDGEIESITIVDATVTGQNYSAALIGVGADVTVKNCIVKESTIESSVSHAGAVVGYLKDGAEIDGCKVNEAEILSTKERAGGVAGSCYGSTITNCSVSNSTVSTQQSHYVGGVAGYINLFAEHSSTINDCNVHNSSILCSIDSSVNGGYGGGIAGYITGGTTISGSSVTSDQDVNNSPLYKIEGDYYNGGITGRVVTSTVSDCNVENIVVRSIVSAYSGGIVGYISDSSVASITECNVKGSSITTNTTYAGGVAGYVAYDKEIVNCSVESSSIRSLTSGTVGGVAGALYYGSEVRDCSVVNCEINAKKDVAGGVVGTLISGSVVDCFSQSVTIGSIDPANYSGGVVGYSHDANSNIVGCYAQDIDIASALSSYVGGLVGRASYTTITRCYSTGDITCGSSYQGGLVGLLEFSNTSECYSTVNINASGGNYLGGFIGLMRNASVVEDNFSTGSITSSLSIYVGGFAGGIQSSTGPENCYYAKDGGSSVNSNGNEIYINPFCGYYHSNMLSDPINCYYADNTIVGDATPGKGTPLDPSSMSSASSFSGFNFSKIWGVVSNSSISSSDRPYLQMEYKKNIVDIISNPENTGTIRGDGYYNDEQVTLEATAPIGYTFDHWEVDGSTVTSGNGAQYIFNCTNDITVEAHFVMADFFSGGDGTENNPYIIETFEDLRLLSLSSEMWDKHFILVSDIDCGSDRLLIDWDGYGGADGATTAGFTPIGSVTIPFSGSFRSVSYGDHAVEEQHAITNLYIDSANSNYCGLFGYVEGSSTTTPATISGLDIVDSDITALSYVGALSGYIKNAVVSNCKVSSSKLAGVGYSGGVIGFIKSSTVSGCSITDVDVETISGGIRNGGFAGAISSSTVTECYSGTGVIKSGGYQCGGFVGYNYSSEIIDCYSKCDVYAVSQAHIGGFVGLDYGVNIINCYAEGDLYGSSYIGGFVGSQYSSSAIKNCISFGTVLGSSTAGSFTGHMQNSATTKDCYSSGAVRGNSSSAGGFVGRAISTSSIESSYLSGSVDNRYYSGSSQLVGTVGSWGGTISSTGNFSNLIFDINFAPFSTEKVIEDEEGASNNISGIESSAFTSNPFNGFAQGADDDNPWIVNNSSARPYLYWQKGVIVDNSIVTVTETGDTYSYDCEVNFVDLSNGVTVVERGLSYRKQSDPVSDYTNWTWSHTGNLTNNSNDILSLTDNDLEIGERYHIRAYAKDDEGNYYYGDICSFQPNHFDGGDGSESNPFEINSFDQLVHLSTNSLFWAQGNHFIQTADIECDTDGDGDLTDEDWNGDGSSGVSGFTPIGDGSNVFKGNYDGRGHLIENLFIDRSSASYVGLFGLVGVSGYSGTISDVELKSVDITGKYHVGALVGYLRYGSSILNCAVHGEVKATSSYSGGLVGYAYYNTVIENSLAIVNLDNSSSSNRGGFIGLDNIDKGANTFKNCYSAPITTTPWTSRAFVGTLHNPKSLTSDYENCYYDSDRGVDAITDIDGITTTEFGVENNFTDWDFEGIWTMTTITDFDSNLRPYLRHQNLPYKMSIRIDTDGAGTVDPEGIFFYSGETITLNTSVSEGFDFIGWYKEDGITLIDPTATTTSFDYNLTGVTEDITIIAKFVPNYIWPCGDGTVNNPYCIENLEALNVLALSPYLWDKHFYLVNDIDASATSTWNSGQGFTPIAYGDNFTGSLSGKNPNDPNDTPHKISGLFIDRPTDNYIGLFSIIKDGGSVFDLILEDIEIYGNNYVGAIVGQLTGVSGTVGGITRCSIIKSSTESINSIDGRDKVGGAAGYCYYYASISDIDVDISITASSICGGVVGYSHYHSTIDSVTFLGTVSATSHVGGIVGYNASTSTVSNSYSGGDVIGTTNIGGIVGYNNGSKIVESYSTGLVTGVSNIGGAIGYNYNLSQVKNCYSRGAVTASGDNVGGFVGANSGSIVSQCYNIGSVISLSSSTGAFIGKNLSSGITNCYFDKETVNIVDSNGDPIIIGVPDLNTDISQIYPLSALESNVSSNFSLLDFGTDSSYPWINNSDGAPYLYWQDNSISDNSETYNYASQQFTQQLTYSGVLLADDPSTPTVESNIGIRYLKYKIDSNGDSDISENSIWEELYSVSSSTLFSMTINDLEGRYLIQPFIVNENGQRVYGDMITLDAPYIPEVETLWDANRGISSSTFKGLITQGVDIIEHGFVYSYSVNSENDLTIDNSTIANPVVFTKSSNLTSSPVSVDPNATPADSPLEISEDITTLETRYAVYIRAYAKDNNGVVSYGDIVRILTEKRDFSLSLDGGSLLMLDESSSYNHINEEWLNANSNQFSIDLWVRNEQPTASDQILISNRTDSEGYALLINSAGNIVLENHDGSSSVVSSEAISDNSWHHVAATYSSSSSVNIYIDGESLTPTNSSLSLLTPPDPTTLVSGSHSSNISIGAEIVEDQSGTLVLSGAFTGKLDALRFWNSTLSQEQLIELAYDNIDESTNGKVQMRGSEIEIDLPWITLSASLGFNVKSTIEPDNSTLPSSYSSQDELHNYPFFQEDGRYSFNLIAIGGDSNNTDYEDGPKPSFYLPRVNWRYNPIEGQGWFKRENWSGYTYPGLGFNPPGNLTGFLPIDHYRDVVPDITVSTVSNSSDFCKYTVINSVQNLNNKIPLVGNTPPKVNILVDRDPRVGSYKVTSGLLIITGEITPKIFDKRFEINGYEIYIHVGSIEP